MLVLTRKPGQSLQLGDHVTVTIVQVRGNQVRLAIEAPEELRIRRKELTVTTNPSSDPLLPSAD